MSPSKRSVRPASLSGISARQEKLLEAVRLRGFMTIEALASEFDVTPQTIRRDINLLAQDGLLRRFHGGAGLASSVENMAYAARKVLCPEEKQRIGRAVAARIPDKASMFINIGTTTEQVAHALLGHKGLRIITNNLNVANILTQKDDFEVIVAGGLVRNRDKGVIGEATIDLIAQFKVDFGIIGTSALDVDGTMLDFDYREARVSQAIVANSRRIYLVADHTKFGRSAMVRMGSVEMIDALFTDKAPPAAFARTAKSAGVEINIAPAD